MELVWLLLIYDWIPEIFRDILLILLLVLTGADLFGVSDGSLSDTQTDSGGGQRVGKIMDDHFSDERLAKIYPNVIEK